jgi:hypothetical protein
MQMGLNIIVRVDKLIINLSQISESPLTLSLEHKYQGTIFKKKDIYSTGYTQFSKSLGIKSYVIFNTIKMI